MDSESASNFQRWYERNKEEFNAKRRARYHQDQTYKQRVMEYSRISRQRAKSRPKAPKREWLLSEVSALVGVSVTTLRYWEARKYIPKPDDDRIVRRYNVQQVSLLQYFASHYKDYRGLRKAGEMSFHDLNDNLQKLAEFVRREWSNASQNRQEGSQRISR